MTVSTHPTGGHLIQDLGWAPPLTLRHSLGHQLGPVLVPRHEDDQPGPASVEGPLSQAQQPLSLQGNLPPHLVLHAVPVLALPQPGDGLEEGERVVGAELGQAPALLVSGR